MIVRITHSYACPLVLTLSGQSFSVSVSVSVSVTRLYVCLCVCLCVCLYRCLRASPRTLHALLACTCQLHMELLTPTHFDSNSCLIGLVTVPARVFHRGQASTAGRSCRPPSSTPSLSAPATRATAARASRPAATGLNRRRRRSGLSSSAWQRASGRAPCAATVSDTHIHAVFPRIDHWLFTSFKLEPWAGQAGRPSGMLQIERSETANFQLNGQFSILGNTA